MAMENTPLSPFTDYFSMRTSILTGVSIATFDYRMVTILIASHPPSMGEFNRPKCGTNVQTLGMHIYIFSLLQ